MRKEYKNSVQNDKKTAIILISMSFFLLGILISDLLWEKGLKQKNQQIYLELEKYANSQALQKELLLDTLRLRISWWGIIFFNGFTVYGLPVVIIFAGMIGLLSGIFLSTFILQFGVSGGILALSILLPQMVIYYPVFVYAAGETGKLSGKVWSNRGIVPVHIKNYCKKYMLYSIIFAAGVASEIYINPFLIKITIEMIKYF